MTTRRNLSPAPPVLPDDSPGAGPVSRREQNKAATRRAIVTAAVDILRANPDEPITADRLADAAGVSRRTFFNYFGSIEAALNVPMDNFLDLAVENLGTLPEDTPVAEAAVRAIRDAISADALRPVAELFLLAESNPQLARLQLESWNTCAERIVEFLREDDADVPPLAASTFAQALVGAGRAAFAHWGSELGDHSAEGGLARSLGRPSLERLQATVIEALTQLRDGFPALRSTCL
ncbi:TetR/AcrR family transcriptional regulator [Zhihengliuella halotolerans]|uniref:TetR family transcriptional regulator n=1 Tax=Zhihengliuella halotolerans TaxID=370736 RepID=A0A4Q8ACU1_9MICC|nr:TetR/AcrR family transcriptional regulator [Zhihengliuella halotolerans]RZU62030.1 TetR family transcriptional regulator [Zhihengliuella halotolerans]